MMSSLMTFQSQKVTSFEISSRRDSNPDKFIRGASLGALEDDGWAVGTKDRAGGNS